MVFEHEVKSLDKCPRCGCEHGGYDSLDFNQDVIRLRFTCPDCGTLHVEVYEYAYTWFETGKPETGKTGYKCPECGQEDAFDASAVVLTGTTRITEDGWDYVYFPNDAELDDGATLTCCACGHKDAPERFEVEEKS